MGITVSTECRQCASTAPEIGDCGHIGYPSLKDCEIEGMASFERIYRGYAAIGFRCLELDEFRAWLEEHATHDVALLFDDHRVGGRRRYQRPPAIECVGPVTPTDYPSCFFELSCRRCDIRFRTKNSYELLRGQKALSARDLAEFKNRVLDIDDGNFYRTCSVLDPFSREWKGLAAFLRKHQNHDLDARTIAEESWTTPSAPAFTPLSAKVDHREEGANASRVLPRASLPPPLRVEWSIEVPPHAPWIVQGDRLVTLGGDRQWVRALDLSGKEMWRTRVLEPWSLSILFVRGDRVWAPSYRDEAKRHTLLEIDSASGRLVDEHDSDASPETFLEDRSFVGRRYRPNDKPVETVGLYRVASRIEAIWEVEVASELGRPFGQLCATDWKRLFLTHGDDTVALGLHDGRELWRAHAESPEGGRASGWDFLCTDAGMVARGLTVRTYGIDAVSGLNRWAVDCPDAGLSRAIHDGSVVFAGTRHVNLAAATTSHFLRVTLATGEIEAATDTGTPLWNGTPEPRPVFCSAPRPTASAIYVGDANGRLWALSPATGAPLWAAGLPGVRGALLDIVIAQDRLFVSDMARRYCLSSASV